jgi:ketosteroid isomerase-like protein
VTTTASSPRAVARAPEQLHTLVVQYAGVGDVDGLVSLFEPYALLMRTAGTPACGAEALRGVCAALCDGGGRLDVRTGATHVNDDLALMSSSWAATASTGRTTTGRATQVARRQPDGRWLAVIVDLTWSTS